MGKFGKMKKKMFECKLRKYLYPLRNIESDDVLLMDEFIEFLSNFCVQMNNDVEFENEINNRLQLLTRNTIENHIKINKIQNTFPSNNSKDSDSKRTTDMKSELGENSTMEFHNSVGLKLSSTEFDILQGQYEDILSLNEYFELEIFKNNNNNKKNGSRKFCTKIANVSEI